MTSVHVVTAYERGPQVRCQTCYEAAESEKFKRRIIIGIGLVVALVMTIRVLFWFEQAAEDHRNFQKESQESIQPSDLRR